MLTFVFFLQVAENQKLISELSDPQHLAEEYAEDDKIYQEKIQVFS